VNIKNLKAIVIKPTLLGGFHRSNQLALKARELGLQPVVSSAFETGIGINTGEVIAGYIGSPERMDFTVLGDHVNVAARLCSVAKGGRVLVGEPTYDIVKDGVEARSIGTSVLKGKADSVYAYEVLSIKP
ncbi:MAG: adenylate/guanylate cyclase domain-containing protein, partial [Candidatus Hydrogenedentes bacterium]|nr:adenylate/guanylate cyclase domain-containing protein [Candidatus Hydrogenedentota bacterium]